MATEIATLGGGCFWCLEAVYQELKGVQHVESGYTGGQIPNPTYEAVCAGTTGHAEVGVGTGEEGPLAEEREASAQLPPLLATQDPHHLPRYTSVVYFDG